MKENIKKSWKKKNILFKIIFFLLFIFILVSIIVTLFIFYKKVLAPLPDVKDYKTIPMPESSIIYDRNWWELYKIYSEKRTYVTYKNINKNMINAIVSWEDKRFWTNPWYDIIGILRAIFDWLINWKQFSWTSWITQQLARITYLTDERTLTRKIKELYLSIELDSFFSKKDILELYLNKIFFWWNSYGVEQASQTFFWIHASELWILQSSILASLPKAPTWLSPYLEKGKLLGYPLIVNSGSNIKILSKNELENNKEYINLLASFINNLELKSNWNHLLLCGLKNNSIKLLDFKIDSNWCTSIKVGNLLSILNSISIQDKDSIIEYKTWRKDYILWRMLEDSYITFDEYKQAIIWSFWLEFKTYSDDIRYPHLVIYIRDYLFKKYWEQAIKTWAYKIYTTIDPKLQDKAQELIENQVKINIEKFWAQNAALISLDNKTGEILAMVWGLNYFDEKNLGNNNMIFARLQPGSTFKPFIYTLAMIKNSYTKDTILTDEKYTFPWDYTPQDSDWKFMWKMTLSKALNNSRNIPAIKIYYAAWEEDEIIKFLEPFWMNSLSDFKKEFKEKHWYNYVYNAPMALWTVQITPMELAIAYSVFWNNWIKNDIIWIKRIIDSKWMLIESNEIKKQWTRVLDEDMALSMNLILSNTNDRPKSWNYFLTIPGRDIAAKTWTSSKQYKKNPNDKKDTIVPRDLWTVWYTPQITTVVWAWNTSWEELKEKAYGITWAWPIMRDFMDFAHKDLEVENWREK